MSSILIKNIRAVDTVTDTTTDVLIKDGVIAELGAGITADAEQVIDGTGLVLMPSIFDMHVHLRDPGFTYKEDVLTGCGAALAGGVSRASRARACPSVSEAWIVVRGEDPAEPRLFLATSVSRGPHFRPRELLGFRFFLCEG